MPAIRLDIDTEKCLAKKTGRTKTFLSVRRYFEHLEDIHPATQRLQKPARSYSAGEVKRELGL